MSVRVTGPNDLLYEIEDAVHDDVIESKDISSGLEMGKPSWITLDSNKVRALAAKLYEIISSYLQARPSAEIVIGQVSIKLSNISEATINTAIDKAIEASE